MEAAEELAPFSRSIPSARAGHGAHSGLAPASPFPLNSCISAWKNNLAWQNMENELVSQDDLDATEIMKLRLSF